VIERANIEALANNESGDGGTALRKCYKYDSSGDWTFKLACSSATTEEMAYKCPSNDSYMRARESTP
jgi:hypothetical protein